MRHTARSFRGGFYTVNVVDTSPNYSQQRYTQMPSPELNLRRPCLDPVMTGGHPIRKAKMEEGVSFCEPIQHDWEW